MKSTDENICGTCSECCFVMGVDELNKKDHETCIHVFKKGGGCKIYKDRPASCQSYECCYYTWKEAGADIPIGLRPDRCHVVIDFIPTLNAHFIRCQKQYYPDALKNPMLIKLIGGMVLQGLTVVMMVDGVPQGKFREDKVHVKNLEPAPNF